jgi:hypothetical protein
VIFLVTAAEEEGNVGAEAFARFARQLGKRRIVAALNFDMIGLKTPEGIGLYGGVSASEADRNPAFRIAKSIRRKGNMPRLFAGHEEHPRYFKSGSDQAVSAAGKVPSLLYAGAVTDTMHTSRDRFYKVELDTVKGTARHGLRTLLKLGDGRTRLPRGRRLPLDLDGSGFIPWGALYPD